MIEGFYRFFLQEVGGYVRNWWGWIKRGIAVCLFYPLMADFRFALRNGYSARYADWYISQYRTSWETGLSLFTKEQEL
jgi:hypothetical protein